jgi:hypothetical protein
VGLPYTDSWLLVSYKVGTNAVVGGFGSSRQCSFGSRNLGSGTNHGIEFDGRAWSSTNHTPRHVVWEYVARQYRSISSTSICNVHQDGPTHAGGFGVGKGKWNYCQYKRLDSRCKDNPYCFMGYKGCNSRLTRCCLLEWLSNVVAYDSSHAHHGDSHHGS